ncbi:MAG: hypothetical protein WC294_00715 [Methanoregula sp.]|jgi:hypothetical protein
MAFSKHGKYWYRKDSWQDYEKVPWSTVSLSSRRKIMKHLMPKPDACPFCGALSRVEECRGIGPAQIWGDGVSERVLILVNCSGKLKEDLDDWYWTCRECFKKEQREKNQRYPVELGDKLKPWSELTRWGKKHRVRRDLPMTPCEYCGNERVELFSYSGEWLEALDDYVWLCRSHVVELAELLHEKPVPIEQCDPDLFPWLYNSKSMGGSFLGYSILGINCAMGRFYHILKKVSRKRV